MVMHPRLKELNLYIYIWILTQRVAKSCMVNNGRPPSHDSLDDFSLLVADNFSN